ncbi:hypothetical protein PHYBOEH_011857 [Phytophthora boehmeriae]|uniref:M96 mating-specific protein family n=1 Tax=Phytophthora boehmeriae TaxID=109152 RepID=A0A8T1WWN4_9STRA|nr:hypothetical protein PHYBOEH_011857 [Phytophthora boehmeriae]
MDTINETIDVDALLAFIDTFDVVDAGDEPSKAKTSAAMGISIDQKPLRNKRQSSRPTNSVPYSTVLQRRKRFELLALRSEFDDLNAKLARIQQRHQEHSRNAVTVASQSSTAWRNLAAIASEKRKRAEHTKRELNELRARHLRLCLSMRKALDKTDAFNDMAFVFQLQSKVNRPVIQHNFSEAVLEELSNGLEHLHRETDAMFLIVDMDTEVGYHYEYKQQHTSVSYMDYRSTTPMACTVQQAGDLLWKFASRINTNADTPLDNVRKQTPSPIDVTGSASLREGLQCLNLSSVYRSWTVISPSTTDPKHSSVIRNRYRLEVKFLAPTNEAVLHAQEKLLRTVGKKMCMTNQSMQNAMLSHPEFGRYPSS